MTVLFDRFVQAGYGPLIPMGLGVLIGVAWHWLDMRKSK